MESVRVGFQCPFCEGIVSLRVPGQTLRFRAAQLLDDALTWHLSSHVDDFLEEVSRGPQRDGSSPLRPADTDP